MPSSARPAPRSWLTWIETQIRRYDSARAFAAALGVDTSKLSRWRSPYPLIPQAGDLERLAQVTGTDLEELLLMTWAVERERETLRARPPLGAVASPAAPSAKPASGSLRAARSRPRATRKALTILLTAATALLAGLAAPRAASEASPLGVGAGFDEVPLIGRSRRPGGRALVPVPA